MTWPVWVRSSEPFHSRPGPLGTVAGGCKPDQRVRASRVKSGGPLKTAQCFFHLAEVQQRLALSDQYRNVRGFLFDRRNSARRFGLAGWNGTFQGYGRPLSWYLFHFENPFLKPFDGANKPCIDLIGLTESAGRKFTGRQCGKRLAMTPTDDREARRELRKPIHCACEHQHNAENSRQQRPAKQARDDNERAIRTMNRFQFALVLSLERLLHQAQPLLEGACSIRSGDAIGV